MRRRLCLGLGCALFLGLAVVAAALCLEAAEAGERVLALGLFACFAAALFFSGVAFVRGVLDGLEPEAVPARGGR